MTPVTVPLPHLIVDFLKPGIFKYDCIGGWGLKEKMIPREMGVTQRDWYLSCKILRHRGTSRCTHGSQAM